jgi:tetratricopeptide (TPR) repeat protein
VSHVRTTGSGATFGIGCVAQREHWSVGMAQFMARRFDEAAATLQLSLQELPHYANTHRFLAACYAQMGRLDEAREVVKRLRAITPSVMPNLTTYWNREQRELYLDGLRLAAGEVG